MSATSGYCPCDWRKRFFAAARIRPNEVAEWLTIQRRLQRIWAPSFDLPALVEESAVRAVATLNQRLQMIRQVSSLRPEQ